MFALQTIYKKWDTGYSWKLTATPAVQNQSSPEFEDAVRNQICDGSLDDFLRQVRSRQQLQQQQQQQRRIPLHASRLPLKFIDFRGFETLKNRPPFFGRADRTSNIVKGRNPFAKETEEIVDYDWDSEEDWEPDGEDIENSDGEEDREEGDEEKDGFVVPDGTYSDDEGIAGDGDRLVGISTTSNAQSVVLIQGADLSAFATHIKLHVTVSGPSVVSQYDCDINGMNVLEKERQEEKRRLKQEDQRKKNEEKQRKMLTDAMLPDLVRIIHGTQLGKDKIIEEFLAQYPMVSKSQVSAKLNDIATKEKKVHREGGS